MITLAFDCSSEDIIVALKGNNGFVQDIIKNVSGTENLMFAIDNILSKNNIKISEVEHISVGVGPGSWTGSRVAVVSAIGLYDGMEVKPKISMFTSFDAVVSDDMEEDDFILVPAFSNLIYAKQVSGEPFIDEIDNVKEMIGRNKAYSSVKTKIDTNICQADLSSILSKIEKEKLFVDINDVEPLYLRKSQAEIQFEERNKK